MILVFETIISGVIGVLGGTVGYYYVNRYLEKKREALSTKREQLQYVYGPLEVLMKMNNREFYRYFKKESTLQDKEYIERHIWYPNNTQIRRIIMEKSHLLPDIPDLLLDLLTHINVWLSEYELTYIRKTQDPPVFSKPGYTYPQGVDALVFEKSKALRKVLNIS